MRILVTGSNGFIAGSVIAALSSSNTVIGIGRSDVSKNQCDYFKCDICNRYNLWNSVKKKIRNIEVVIHCAASIDGAVDELYRTNCLGTQNVVDLAVELNCISFIHISSIPIIGHPKERIVTEEIKANPLTTYHRTKFFAEQIVSSLDRTGVNYKNLRIASPVGKNMPSKKIFSVFVESAKHGKNIKIFGNGKRVQNYIDIRDIAYAVKLSISNGSDGLYLLAGNSISDLELAKKCKNYFASDCSIDVKEDACHIESDRWILDANKARNEFGYSPQIDINESIRYVSEAL